MILLIITYFSEFKPFERTKFVCLFVSLLSGLRMQGPSTLLWETSAHFNDPFLKNVF
jgi:hypothetical protein